MRRTEKQLRNSRSRRATWQCALALCVLVAPVAAMSDSLLLLPVPATCISSTFGDRPHVGPRAETDHHGIDLPAAAGAWVRAAADGEVVRIRKMGSLGLAVDVRHGALLARYAHLGSLSVDLAGGVRKLKRGDPIGRVGRTGVTYGTHLHFELRTGGILVNPARYFDLAPCASPRTTD